VRREIIEQFALVSRSVFSEAERLIRAARAGYRITAFPVQTSGRRSSAARGARLELLMGSLKDVVRVWRALRHERQEYDRTTLQSSENAES